MLAEGRDVMAVLFLEARLSELREAYLERALERQPPGPGFWKEGERAIRDELKRRYYNRDLRTVVKPDDASMSDEEDFEERTQKLTEHALFETHRRLAAIPYHGHPDYLE